MNTATTTTDEDDDVHDPSKPRRSSHVPLLLLLIVSLIFGEAVWVTGLQFLTQGSSGRFHLASHQSGLYATAFFAGQCVSSYFFGWLADVRGRRFSLLTSMMTALLFGTLTAIAPVSESSPLGWLPLLICCLLTGVGVGGAIPVTQSLVVELFPAARRGFYSSIASLGWPIGGVISTVAGWLLFPKDQITPTDLSPSPSPSSSSSSASSSSSSSSSAPGWTLVCLTNTNLGASRCANYCGNSPRFRPTGRTRVISRRPIPSPQCDSYTFT